MFFLGLPFPLKPLKRTSCPLSRWWRRKGSRRFKRWPEQLTPRCNWVVTWKSLLWSNSMEQLVDTAYYIDLRWIITVHHIIYKSIKSGELERYSRREWPSFLWKLAFSRFRLHTVPRTSHTHRHQADLEVGTGVVTDTPTTWICSSCGRAMGDTVQDTKDVKEKKVTFKNEDCRKLMFDFWCFRVCW